MTAAELAQMVAGHDKQIEALQEDRRRQNGTLERLEDKLDKVNERIDGLRVWAIGFVLALLGLGASTAAVLIKILSFKSTP